MTAQQITHEVLKTRSEECKNKKLRSVERNYLIGFVSLVVISGHWWSLVVIGCDGKGCKPRQTILQFI